MKKMEKFQLKPVNTAKRLKTGAAKKSSLIKLNKKLR